MTSDATPGEGNASPTILVVDDTPEDRLLVGTIVQNVLGWKATYAADGLAALEAIEREKPQMILSDLQMPRSNGLKLVTAVRKKHPMIPVILMTAHGSEEIALKALQAGAASYVPKRNLDRDLADVLDQVLASSREAQRRACVVAALARAEFEFVLDNDRLLVSELVSHVQQYVNGVGLCDQTARTRLGVALEEAVLNAMHHGNLELSSDLRKDGDEPYHRLAEERRRQPPYQGRRVHLSLRLSPDEAVFTVRDEGPGFNPGNLPDPTDPANLEKSSGRGLLLIRTFMDHVEFNETGNQITMVKRRDAAADARAAT